MTKWTRLGILYLFLLLPVMHLPIADIQAAAEQTTIVSENEETDLYLSFVEECKKEFTPYIRKSWIPGLALCIVKGDQTLWMEGFGKTKAGGPEINSETVFRLASTSKGIAGLLAACMVESGDITWDTPLKEVLPDFTMKNRAWSDRINIQHILTHTAGVPYHTYTNLIEAGISLDKISREMKKVRNIAHPGALYSYQNAAFSLIDPVLEERTGISYSQLLKQRIFMPLGMNNAVTTFDDFIKNPNAAYPHLHTRRGWIARKIKSKYFNAIPAGGMCASISDMSEYLKGLMGYRPDVISRQVLDQMFTSYINTPVRRKYFSGWQGIGKVGYGMGWRIADYQDRQIYYHGGYIDGYRSEIAIDPGLDLGVCVLSNSHSHLPKKLLIRILKKWEKFMASHPHSHHELIMP